MFYFYIYDVHCLSNQNHYQLDIWHKDFMFTRSECLSTNSFFIIQKALEGYLQNQADLQVSLDRLRDTSDPIISVEEIREEIGL